MQRKIDQAWVSQLAGTLLCEIMYQMSGITLAEVGRLPTDFHQRQVGIVCGRTIGEYTIHMWLVAEEALFRRMAERMIGAPPRDQSEIEEYATEFFNVICGRFVSELYYLYGSSARFLPTTYTHPQDAGEMCARDRLNTVKLVSDGDEGAIFSWTLLSEQDK